MIRHTVILLSFLLVKAAIGQIGLVEDLEGFALGPDSFLNGSDGSGRFEIAGGYLPNNYDTTFQSWTGWAISSMTDTTTAGFGNQYSAIAGSGKDASHNYAVSYHFIPNTMQRYLSVNGEGQTFVTGMYVTNGTYPYLSMLHGDAFAKKFGGVDGNDPDFFLLTIKGINDIGELDSVLFYLADYRFEDNTQDYIIDDWTYVDLSKLSSSFEFTFELSSSDVGMFGVNTPTYFCIDNIEYDLFSNTAETSGGNLELYPNPTSDAITITVKERTNISLIDATGAVVADFELESGQQLLPIQALPAGRYTVTAIGDSGTLTSSFIKI